MNYIKKNPSYKRFIEAIVERLSWCTLVRHAALLNKTWRGIAFIAARKRRERALERFRIQLLNTNLPKMWAGWSYRYECALCHVPMNRVIQEDPPIWICTSGFVQGTLCDGCYKAQGSHGDDYLAVSRVFSPGEVCDNPDAILPPDAKYSVCSVPSNVPCKYTLGRLWICPDDKMLERMLDHWINCILIDPDLEFGFEQLFARNMDAHWDSVVVKQPADANISVCLKMKMLEQPTFRSLELKRRVGNVLDWIPIAWVTVSSFDADNLPPLHWNCKKGEGRQRTYDAKQIVIVLQNCNQACLELYGQHHYFYNGYWYFEHEHLCKHILSSASNGIDTMFSCQSDASASSCESNDE